jgi:hypothetical protein
MATAVSLERPPAKSGPKGKSEIWKLFDVEFRFLGRLCASVPASPDLIKTWSSAM